MCGQLEPLDEIETPENFSKKGEHSYFVSKTNSPEGPINGQRRVNQEEEEDGGENGNTIPKIRILSTLSVDTGSRGATNTASQSWKPTFHHSFRNHDSGLDMT